MMEFYYVRLLKYLLENKNLKGAERLWSLVNILNTFPYIKKLLCSTEYKGFSYEENLSYNIENFYMRVYIFREAFYLFLNAVFDLRVNEGDTKFRLNITDIIKENKELNFLIDALDELKNNKAIKECLSNWRAIEHQVVKGFDFSRLIGRIEALSKKKLLESEKHKKLRNILNRVGNHIETVNSFLTNFLEQWCKKIFIKMKELK